MGKVEEDVDGPGGVVAGHVERADDVHLRRPIAEHRAHRRHLLLPSPLLPLLFLLSWALASLVDSPPTTLGEGKSEEWPPHRLSD